jgi:hypothetical protein
MTTRGVKFVFSEAQLREKAEIEQLKLERSKKAFQNQKEKWDQLLDGEKPDYDVLKQMSQALGRPAATLLAMADANDPFFVGLPRRRAAAEWFLGIWNTYQNRPKTHLRALHYLLISQKVPITGPNGLPYENTHNCWKDLGNACRDARLLGLVPLEAFHDKRNEEPI